MNQDPGTNHVTFLDELRSIASSRAALTFGVAAAAISAQAFRPNVARADNPVDVVIQVGRPDSSGDIPITMTNQGDECVLVDFNLSESSNNGDGSSSSSSTDIKDTLNPADVVNIYIGGTDEDGNVVVNGYNCSDQEETTPLVSPLEFVLDQPPYSYTLGNSNSTGNSGPPPPTPPPPPSSGNIEQSSSSSTGVTVTSTSTTTTGPSVVTTSNPGIEAPPLPAERCIVSDITRHESIQSAAKSLIKANCALAPSNYVNLSSKQKAEGYRWFITKYVYIGRRGHSHPIHVHDKTRPFVVEPAGTVLPFAFPLTAEGIVEKA